MEFNSHNIIYKYTKSGRRYNVTIEVEQFIIKNDEEETCRDEQRNE